MAMSIVKPLNTKSFQLPLFLAPAFASHTNAVKHVLPTRTFSCSAALPANRARNRETNKQRGVSVIRRTGPRVPLSISKHPLPRPVSNEEQSSRSKLKFPFKEDHGLWGFFNEAKQPMVPPEEEGLIGRAWAYQELTHKSFDDLHRLYWVCIKELNRTLTRRGEMRRLNAGFGDSESVRRVKAIRRTMGSIRAVLKNRHTLREEAIAFITTNDFKDVAEILGDKIFDEAEAVPQPDPPQQEMHPDQIIQQKST